jgi:hypothetical protein
MARLLDAGELSTARLPSLYFGRFYARFARLLPGGVDTQNWMAMFVDRKSDDDENQWIYLGVLGLR